MIDLKFVNYRLFVEYLVNFFGFVECRSVLMQVDSQSRINFVFAKWYGYAHAFLNVLKFGFRNPVRKGFGQRKRNDNFNIIIHQG